MNGDGAHANGPDGSQDEHNKRPALAGQWRTPPLPVFAAQPVTNKEQSGAAEIKIPSSTEDYARALQEAYRKGAEAAAKLAQQQQNIPNASSCPNFSSSSPPPNSSTPQPVSSSTPSLGVLAEEAAYTAASTPQVMMPPQNGHMQPETHSISASMPPPPPPSDVNGHTTMVQFVAPPPLPNAQAQAQQPASNTAVAATAQSQSQEQSRSLSLPDMSAYAVKAEEEKRQKRLARNRASARLRRLRKKNLVDAYETEVGILEKNLKQLRAHEWGRDDDHKALLDALGMERGQQAIPPEQRAQMIQSILAQQLQQVELLRQAQLEQECLAMLGSPQPDDEGLAGELQDLLRLSDDQKANLANASRGLDTEVDALETIAASLQAMQENQWLVNDGVQSITDQFTSILHKNQLSKFLLWADANVDAIDQLDHVQVQPLQSAPIFTFGVETAPGDDDEK